MIRLYKLLKNIPSNRLQGCLNHVSKIDVCNVMNILTCGDGAEFSTGISDTISKAVSWASHTHTQTPLNTPLKLKDADFQLQQKHLLSNFCKNRENFVLGIIGISTAYKRMWPQKDRLFLNSQWDFKAISNYTYHSELRQSHLFTVLARTALKYSVFSCGVYLLQINNIFKILHSKVYQTHMHTCMHAHTHTLASY